MCGIIGIVGAEPVADRLLDGLKRLEYRGYDSAGIATVVDGAIERRRAPGKLKNLAARLREEPLEGETGIAHTRWATHGAPTEDNAHPHIVGDVSLVHNGIIENFKPLRDELIASGATFNSQTDSEVVAHLISRELEGGKSPQEAVAAVLPRLHGAFAIAVMFRSQPDLLIGARLGAPLTVGYGEGENYLGSDALALAPLTQRIVYLEEGDWAVVRHDDVAIFDQANQPVRRPIVNSGASGQMIDKGNHRHFMQKEIYEQPIVVAQTLQSYLRPLEQQVALPDMDFDLGTVERVAIVACGTASYVGMIGKYWIEQFARLPGRSRCRFRIPLPRPGSPAQHARHRGLAIRRDRRHAGGPASHEDERRHHRRHHQRADQLDGARGRPASLDPCRAGDRRRLDQGLHLPARRHGRACRQSRPRQGPPARRPGARDRRHLSRGPGRHERGAQPSIGDRAHGPHHRERPRRPLSRPRSRLSDGAWKAR
jgi:hypothetical protein